MKSDPSGLRACTTQESSDFGLFSSNCWIGTDDIAGECVTAECAAGILPNEERSDLHTCYAVCIGVGQAESKSIEELLGKQGEHWEEAVCKGQSSKIKVNKVLNSAGLIGKVGSVITSVVCFDVCNENFGN